MIIHIDNVVFSQLYELFEYAEPDAFDTMINDFCAHSLEALENLHSAVNSGNFENLHKLAHTFKGSSGMFGAAHLSTLWSELEQMTFEMNPNAISQQIARIEAETLEVKLALPAERNKRQRSASKPRAGVLKRVILIVDDDEMTRQMISKVLTAEGYTVEEAKNGAEGLQMFVACQPDLVFLDGMMPVMDGFMLCRRIQRLPRGSRTPIIMITGLHDQESVDRAFEAGAADYITKPLHWPTLFQRVQRLLLIKQSEDDLKKARVELEMRVQQRTLELTVANERLQQEIVWREQVKEALRQSEERLRRITDNMLDIIYQTDANGIIAYASPSCQNALGYSLEELLGQSIYQWIHPDDLENVKTAIAEIGRAEYRYQRADGTYIWLESLNNFLFDNGPNITGMVLASRDITKRKLAEQKLWELNRLKTEFLSTAAHELRTPLVSIRGFTEILLMRQLEPTRQQQYLNLINEQSIQLGNILDDLLDISRLESRQRLTLTLEPVDIREVINRVVSLFEIIPDHPIQVVGKAQATPILGDAPRLAQILKNLVSNAIKYSAAGSPITITVEQQPDCLQIGIQDRGIGLTPEQQTHLFEKFYRADASNTAVGGTGLGLAICKLLVELHEGTLWAESKYGVGTTFFFTLPLLQTRKLVTP